MPNILPRILEQALVDGAFVIGEIAVRATHNGHGFELCHRDDVARRDLDKKRGADLASEIARFDDKGNYRPLRTAPSLRHGWRLEVDSLEELALALNQFYPGRLAIFARWKPGQLNTTTLRETLDRQSGMYRVAARISDEEIDDVVAGFCTSDGGCLRTILWKRDSVGTPASKKLPPEKFDPGFDQLGRGERAIPLLCQEACNLLVAKCRERVKSGTA